MTDKLTPDDFAKLKEAAEKYIDAFRNQCNSQGDLHLYHKGEADRHRRSFEKLSTPHTILALLSENERLREALGPFANESNKFVEIPGIIKTHDDVELWQPGGSRKCELTVGDLRRAKAALGE